MAYTPKSTAPGTSNVCVTDNSSTNPLRRMRFVKLYGNNLITANDKHYETVGCFMQSQNCIPDTYTALKGASSLYLKGIVLSLLDKTFNYNTIIKDITGGIHVSVGQLPDMKYADICTNGLLIIPNDDFITNIDAISTPENQATGKRVVFIKNVNCSAIKTIDCHASYNNVKALSKDTEFETEYAYNSQWGSLELYDNLTITILLAKLSQTWSSVASQSSNACFNIEKATIEIKDNITGRSWIQEFDTNGNAEVENNYILSFIHYHTAISSAIKPIATVETDSNDKYNLSIQTAELNPIAIPRRVYKDCLLELSHVLTSTNDFAATTETDTRDILYFKRVENVANFSSIKDNTPDNISLLNTKVFNPSNVAYYIVQDDEIDDIADEIYDAIKKDSLPAVFDFYYNGKIVSNATYSLYKYKTYNGFERNVFQSKSNTADLTELTTEQIEKMDELTEIPYASMTSEGLFVTPMEYYAGYSANSVEGAQLRLENKVTDSATDIPTYFWIETLKNWCTYEYEKLTNWNGFARLKVWNGKNGWYYLDEILQQQRVCQLTAKQLLNARSEYLNEQDVQQNLDRLTKYRNIVVANSSLYRFPYERLRTTVLQRVYTPKNTPNWIVEDDTFFLVRVISKAVDFVCDWAMMIVDWSPIGLVYNSYTNGVGAAFGAGWNRLKSALDDICDGFSALISPVVNWLFSDAETTNTLEKRLKKIDTRKLLVNAVEYLFLPYDTNYTSSDNNTMQTIRFRNEWQTDGIVSRTGLKAGHNVCNAIGSPLVVRSSTGELTLAVSMTYQGPWKQYAGNDDYEKKVGISQSDVDLTNKMLAKMLGDGTDKTAQDYLNIRGGLLSNVITTNSTSLNSVLSNNVVEQTNSSDKVSCELTITANRSKTSSEVESVVINTLKKW